MKKFALFLAVAAAGAALCATAQAKFAPVNPQPNVLAVAAIATGAAGATREQDYFNAPASAGATERVLPCRLQLRIFDKTRLAQWCH
jgi:hypothetical protein